MIKQIPNRRITKEGIEVLQPTNEELWAKLNELIAAYNEHTHEVNLGFNEDMDADDIYTTNTPQGPSKGESNGI